MKRNCAVLIAILVIAFSANLIRCRRDREDPLILHPGETTNLTYLERYTALTQCLENKDYPSETVKGLQDLFKEFKGKTDGFYLIRAAEFIGDDYLRGKNCVCRGIYSSAELGTANHCFSSQDEWDFILDLCLAKSSSIAARYLPKVCGVPSFKELRECCKNSKPKD